MSTPNPLIPQGTFQAQAAKGASNVRLAVATIVAIHIVFFGGLLLQGCKRDPQAGDTAAAAETNINTLSETNLSLAPIDSNSLYYPAGGLPTDAPTGQLSTAQPESNSLAGQPLAPANNAEAMWQNTNLTGPGTLAGGTADQGAAGPMKEYTVVKNDSFGKIAKQNHTTVSALRKANPNVDPVKIRPGQKINVPAAAAAAPEGIVSGNAGSPRADSGNAGTYSVKAGDTLTKIARNHGLTVSQLRAANNLKTSRVNVGQKLKIPEASPKASPTNIGAPAGQSTGQVF